MRLPPAPIRFLLLIVGGWIGLRAVMLAPAWLIEPAPAAPAAVRSEIARADAPLPAPAPPAITRSAATIPPELWTPRPQPFLITTAAAASSIQPNLFARHATLTPTLTGRVAPVALSAAPAPAAPPVQLGPAAPFYLPPSPPAPIPLQASASRWSGSAWVFLRDGSGGGGLAPGGTLGGSQAGARINYRLNDDRERPLALSARLYSPVDRPQGTEAALGLDWRPLRSLAIHLLAERRQRLGRDGRSDFSLTLYGGGERRLLNGKVRVEAYGQAGVVGVEERDLFADGTVRAGVPVGPLELGAGAWGGAQPNVSRLDIGPQATARLPLGPATIRASAEWRFRIAGDAAPGSGPALTLSTDF